MAVIFHEDFQQAGLDETWGSDITTGTGVIDDSASGTFAPSWGDGAMQASTTTTGNIAVKQMEITTPSDTWLAFSFRMTDASSFTADGNSCTLFSVHDNVSAAGGTELFQVIANRDAGVVRILTADWRAGSQVFTGDGGNIFEVGKAIWIGLQWDSTNDVIQIRIGNQVRVYAALTTTRGNPKLIRMGVLGGNFCTVQYGQLYIDNAQFPLPEQTREATSSALRWLERFEHPVSGDDGTDEAWSEGKVLGAGATLDADADPSTISAPASWGSQAAKFTIGAAAGCLLRHQQATNYSRLFWEFSVYIETEGLANNQEINLAVAKQDHDLGENLWKFDLFQHPNLGLVFSMDVDRDGAGSFKQMVVPRLTVATGTFYKIGIKFDATNGFYAVWINDTLYLEASIRTAENQTCSDWILGQSGSSSGRNSTWWTDNYAIAETGWPVVVEVAPTGIASAAAIGAATVSSVATISGASIASAEAIGSATVAAGAAVVAPTGIGSGESFGSAIVGTGALVLSPTGIASAESIGSAVVGAGAAVLAPTGITSGESFGAAVVGTGAAVLAPTGITSGESFGAAVVGTGASAILPGSIASGELLGAAVVSVGAAPIVCTSIPSAESFGSPLVTTGGFLIAPVGIAGGEAFGAAVVGAGAVGITVSGILSAESFGAPAVFSGVTIAPVGIASAEAIGAGTLSTGAATVSPVGIASAEAFGTPFLAGGVVDLGFLRATVRARASVTATPVASPALSVSEVRANAID